MSLGADVAAILPHLQAQAESMMQDTCTVTRGGMDVFNPDTGQYEPAPGPLIYTGKCRIQSGGTQAANPEAGGAVFTVEKPELQLPFGVSLEVGDQAVIDSSVNPALVGVAYRVTGLGLKTHATSARYAVEVVT